MSASLIVIHRSIVVDYLKHKFDTEGMATTCIFFSYKEQEAQSPVNVLSSILQQILQANVFSRNGCASRSSSKKSYSADSEGSHNVAAIGSPNSCRRPSLSLTLLMSARRVVVLEMFFYKNYGC